MKDIYKKCSSLGCNVCIKQETSKEKADYLFEIEKKLNITSHEQWYEFCDNEIFKKNGLSGLLSHHYCNSALMYILHTYKKNKPEINFNIYKFVNKPQGFWNILKKTKSIKYTELLNEGMPDILDAESNIVNFVKYIEKNENIKNPEDWYEKCTYQLFRKYKGSGLLPYFLHSPIAIILFCYNRINKSFKFDVRKFNRLPNSFWDPNNKLTQREKSLLDLGVENIFDGELNAINLIKSIELELKIKDPYEWYNFCLQDIFKNNQARSVLSWYENSPIKFLIKTYKLIDPKIDFKIYNFKNTVLNFWSEGKNIRDAILDFTKENNISILDIPSIGSEVFINNGFRGMFQKYKTLYEICINYFPEHKWNKDDFHKRQKTQKRVYALLKKHKNNISYNERKKHGLVFSETKRKMEIDIYCHDEKWGIEVDGAQHKNNVFKVEDKIFKRQIECDREKEIAAAENNIKLIRIDQEKIAKMKNKEILLEINKKFKENYNLVIL